MPKETQELARLIEVVGSQIRERMCLHMKPELTLSLTQIRLLKTIFQAGSISMAEIAKHLRITPASATSLVNRMVKQGWLERKADEHDRRKINIALSEEKQKEWKAHHANEKKLLAEYVSVLDEKETKTFIELLTKLTTR